MALGDKVVKLEGLKAVHDYTQGQIGELKSALSGNISRQSWGIKIERFKNIVYSEKLFSNEALTKQSAAMIEKSEAVRFQNNPYTIHFKTNTTASSTEIRITVSNAFQLLGTQEFEMPVYISDATNVSGLSFRIGGGANFSKANDVTPVTGWNKFRFFSEGAGNWIEDTDATLFRVIVNHSAGTDIDVYIGSIMQIMPDKGNLIVVADGPYYSFYTEAYPGLKQIGVPVTWAIDPTLLDANDAVTRKLINENELELLATDGLSEFSFHTYDSTIMIDATAQQALADTLNNIRYLQKKGIQPNKIWRAAWLNNACADPSLANKEVFASATYTGTSGIAVFPFRDRYNIPRYSIGGRTTSEIDAMFEKLRRQHCTQFIYMHGISDNDKDTPQATLNYLIDKISAGISAGYLNPTTFNRLVAHYEAE